MSITEQIAPVYMCLHRELEQQAADLRAVCKSTAAERQASQELLSSSTVTASAAAKSPLAAATQAIARSTTMASAAATPLIPPLPDTKLITNGDFVLPPSVAQRDVVGNGSVVGSGGDVVRVENATGVFTSKTVKKATSEERQITTRTLIPNSVYSPPPRK